MASGDIIFFNKWKKAQEDGSLSSTPVDFDTDTIKVAVMAATYTPDGGDASAQQYWGDISANQVALAAAYTGPITVGAKTVTLSAGVVVVDGGDIVIAQAAAGFTNGRWVVFFKDSGVAGTSPLMWYGDLGSNRSIVTGSLTFAWAATGIIRKT